MSDYCNTNTVETEIHALLQYPNHNDDILKLYQQNNINIQNEKHFSWNSNQYLDTGALQALCN